MVTDHFHVSAVDLGLHDHHLALAEQPGIVVFLVTGQQVVPALGNFAQEVGGLQLADAQHVESDVVVEVAVLDDPVIRDDLHVVLVRGFHHGGHDAAAHREL